MKKNANQNAIAIRTRIGAWLFIAAALWTSFAAVLLRGGAVEWLVLSLTLAIVMISGLAPLIGVLGLEAVRTIHHKITQSGGTIEAVLTIKHRFGMPLVWAAVGERLINTSTAYPSAVQFRTVLASLRRGEQSITYTWEQLDRGCYQYEPLAVAVGDWLGFTACKLQIALEDTFTVLPAQLDDTEKQRRAGLKLASQQEKCRKQEEAPNRIAQLQRHRDGLLEADTLQQQAGQGPHSRQYREGDSFMHIDYRALARGQGLHTKVNDYEQPVVKLRILDNGCSRTNKGNELDRLFNQSISWLLLELEQSASAGEHQLVYMEQGSYLVSDVRSDKYEQQLYALRHGLAAAVPKFSTAALDASRLASFSAPVIDVFTTDWKQGDRWLELNGQLKRQGKRLVLHIVAGSSVLSYQMREQQKLWEAEGISLKWLYFSHERANAQVQTGGAQQYDFA
ncbi:DUF58 domain-containing protein [Paenibacillus sp. GXUN7292]|uniref:DUF58 domain-containing protein n=1 Tax=Paenibacillus sp. GXUN7292 TaxID=3422499 RepID=UPI003D7ECB92